MQFPTKHKSDPLSVVHCILLQANAIKAGKEHIESARILVSILPQYAVLTIRCKN